MPNRPSPPTPALACLLLAAALALPARALAGDARPVDVPLTNGKTLTGVVEEGDAREVVIRIGPDQVRRIPWSRLAPLGYYRAKRALAPAAEGSARLQLAELAVDLGLYVEAREEYEKALALGAIKKERFQRAVADAEHQAVENGVRYAERMADGGDLEAAMEVARTLKLHFATAPNAGAVSKLVASLVQRVQTLDQAAAKEKAELEQVVIESKREKEILERKTKAMGLYNHAEKLMEAWARARDQGSVTQTRKHAETADTMLQEARIHLGRLRRILPRAHPAREEILAQLTKLDKLQFDLRLGMATFEKQQTVYKRAERWAALASYIDPLHPDLVEIRDQLLTSRIRYRMSDVTNARGRVGGP